MASLKQESNVENIVLGINLGKNKLTVNAHEDYVKGIKAFGSIADYFVVNISSPNTAGLRNLQQGDNLKLLLSEVIAARNELKLERLPPVLLKIAPDLNDAEVQEIVSVISQKECRVDGLIISNTTVERDAELKSDAKGESGGLSGRPLHQRSTALIAKIFILTKGQFPIVGVGGVFR